MREVIEQNPILAYLGLAFGFSWSLWSVLIVTTPPAVLQDGPPPFFFVLAALGGLGPSLAGVITIAATKGKKGVQDLFDRVRQPLVGIQWYAAALLISPLIGVLTLTTERLLGMKTATREEMMATLPLSMIYPIFAALGEELGWRGFLLSALQQEHSPLKASIGVGLAWGLWHIPTQILAWRHDGWLVIAENVFVTHVMGISAQSIIMTWIYNETKQNLLLMILTHYSITFTAMFLFPLSSSAFEIVQHWIVYDSFYWLAAVFAIVCSGQAFFIVPEASTKNHEA